MEATFFTSLCGGGELLVDVLTRPLPQSGTALAGDGYILKRFVKRSLEKRIDNVKFQGYIANRLLMNLVIQRSH